jgi:hypothetical protein
MATANGFGVADLIAVQAGDIIWEKGWGTGILAELLASRLENDKPIAIDQAKAIATLYGAAVRNIFQENKTNQRSLLAVWSGD